MYVHQLEGGTVGVSAADGKVLWTYARTATRMGNVHTALVAGDRVFCSCGWGTGWGLVRVVRDKDAFRAEEAYFVKGNLDPWLGSSVLVGGEVHTSCGKRIDLETGRVREDLRLARGTAVYADGRLYRRKSDGTLLLHEVTPGGYAPRGEFRPPRAGNAPPWSFPVLAGGKLFIRDQGLLLCYDVRDADGDRRPAPGAVFVPTPQDVVEEMLKLAGVKKADVVYDLGCGDGRILVTAARKYGCRAVGYELDRRLVEQARASAKEHGVEALVTVEPKDLFTADLGRADVVALYLTPRMLERLLPRLARLKPGARVVAHAFPLPGVKPDRVVTYRSGETGREHRLYLWTAPLQKSGQAE
jgi:hypothetical protein